MVIELVLVILEFVLVLVLILVLLLAIAGLSCQHGARHDHPPVPWV